MAALLSSPLRVATKLGDEKSTRSSLLKGADFAALNNRERTSLHVAAREGDLAVEQALLAAEGDVDSTLRRHRQSAMRTAPGEGHVDISRVLIQHGWKRCLQFREYRST